MEEVLEPQVADLESKGLRKDAVGLLGSVTIGLASTAPVFSLAATIGYLVLVVGEQSPAAMIMGFIPMALVAVAYKELNRVIPDCGTTFTWAAKAFGPRVGWMGGWGIAAAGIIFVANAADVAAIYTLQLYAQFTGAEAAELEANNALVIPLAIAFIALLTWITYRGVEGSARLQYVLLGVQYAVLAAIVVTAFWAVSHGTAPEGAQVPQLSWLNPLAMGDWNAFIEGMLLAVFIYWGWDTVLAINEETVDREKTPGRSAVLSTVILLATYVIVTIAMEAYVGVGDSGLANEDTADDVFALVAQPLLGNWGAPILLIAVLLSTAATLQTTIMPTARGALAMSVYQALPARFSAIQPKYLTPSFSTIMMGVVGGAFYVTFKMLSDNLLQDTILSIGLAIAFYYGITAFTAAWYFRKDALLGVRDFLMLFLLPLLGGLMLTGIFVQSAVDMWAPDYGYTTLFGIGGTFVMGIGALLVGVVLMIIWNLIAPAYFRGETLHRDTPVLVPED